MYNLEICIDNELFNVSLFENNYTEEFLYNSNNIPISVILEKLNDLRKSNIK